MIMQLIKSVSYFFPIFHRVQSTRAGVSNSSSSRLIPVAQNAPRFFVLSLLFLCFASGFSLVIRAQNATFLRHSFVAVSLPLLGFGSRAQCRVAPFFSVSNFPNSAADNQGTNAPRFLVLSLFCLCFFSALPRVSISSLFRLSLVCLSFFAPKS
jgi:hypothetical protein